MVKTNDGLLALGLLVVVVASASSTGGGRRRWPCVPLVVRSSPAGWRPGQSVSNIASYCRGSLSVAIGYSSAMQVSHGRSAEDWYAVLVCALLVALFALSVRGKTGSLQGGGAGCSWRAGCGPCSKKVSCAMTTTTSLFSAWRLAAVLLARLKRAYVPFQAGVFVVTAVVFCAAARQCARTAPCAGGHHVRLFP